MPVLGDAEVDFALEPLSPGLWGEIEPLAHQHWSEVAPYKDLALNPDFAAYDRVQSAGRLRIYTARVAGVLVGYLSAFLATSMHYSPHRMATVDAYFVAKCRRGTRIGVDLIRYAHSRMRKDDNVLYVIHSTKVDKGHNLGALFDKFLGMKHIEALWYARLDGG